MAWTKPAYTTCVSASKSPCTLQAAESLPWQMSTNASDIRGVLFSALK